MRNVLPVLKKVADDVFCMNTAVAVFMRTSTKYH